MMQTILSSLSCGNLCPADKEIVPKSLYAKRAGDLERCAGKLEQCLERRRKRCFENISPLWEA